MLTREAEVFESLRKGAASRPQLPGLVGFSLSRILQDRAVVLVSVSYWTDIDTMAAALGPGWRQPSWPGLNEHLTGATVEILETVATPRSKKLSSSRPKATASSAMRTPSLQTAQV
jgi:hypothetical protein